jgi:hypothetical protein
MSTPEQRRGDSTRRQLAATKAYADLHDLEIDHIILDSGVSAFHGENTAFGELSLFLGAVEDGRVPRGSILIVESLDRITRQNMFEAFGVLGRIIESGITLVTLQDNQTYSRETLANNQAALMFAVVTLLRSHEESKTKSLRLSAVWQEKKRAAATGKLTGQRIPLWLSYGPEKAAIEIVAERADLVREIFELSRDGWGSHSICRKLNEDGNPPWNAKTKVWQESYIKKILGNRAVLGEYQPHRNFRQQGKVKRVPEGEAIRDYYPAILSEDLFQEAQAAIKSRHLTGRGRKGKALSNLFSGLLLCGNCGSGVRFIDKGAPPKGGTYLRCSNSAVKGACKTAAIRYSIVEECLLGAIEDLDLDYVLHGERRDITKANLQAELRERERLLRELDDRLSKLTDAVEFANEPMPSLLERMMEVQQLKAQSRLRKEVVERELSALLAIDAPMQKARLEALFAHLRGRESEADLEKLRRAISAEVRRIIRWIKITQIRREPHEYRLEPSIWPEASKLSDKEIAILCANYPFEIAIGYRSGDVQSFDPLTQERVRIRENAKMRVLRRKLELAQIGSQQDQME